MGERIDLPTTRRIIRAAISGELNDVETRRDPIFNLAIPVSCPGVSEEILDPRATWSNEEEYETTARELAQRFHKNFDAFSGAVSQPVRDAGPAPL